MLLKFMLTEYYAHVDLRSVNFGIFSDLPLVLSSFDPASLYSLSLRY